MYQYGLTKYPNATDAIITIPATNLKYLSIVISIISLINATYAVKKMFQYISSIVESISFRHGSISHFPA